MSLPDLLANFWDNLLSREPEKIRSAFATLDAETRTAVLTHLHRMVSEEGWHPEQRRSARAALDAAASAPPTD